MQTRNPFLDDLAQAALSAADMARGVAREADALARSQAERILARLDVVTREEYDAMADLARDALARVEALEARVDELEAKKG